MNNFWWVSSLVALLIATFGDLVKRFITRCFVGPKIDVLHMNELPYNKHANALDPQRKISIPSFYIRLKIKNVGRTTVHGLYGRLLSIKYLEKKEEIKTFDPCTLNWVGSFENRIISLSPGDYEFMDLIFTSEGDPRFHVQTERKLRGIPFDFEIERQPHVLQIALYSDDGLRNLFSVNSSQKYPQFFNN